jgi:hypothetical protein
VVEVGGTGKSYQKLGSCPDVQVGKAELAADGFLLPWKVGTVAGGVCPVESQ